MSTVTVSSGNSPYNVSSGESDTNDVVVSGGSMLVDSGGTASATTVNSGGSETVNAGGTDLGAQISGGTQVDYGLASGATVSAGLQEVDSGGTAISATISSGGTQEIGLTGSATATSTTISSGGAQIVGDLASGTATGTTILGGGVQLIGNFASGTATDTTISSGGTQVVGNLFAGTATATSTTILSGGEQWVGGNVSGAATDTTISNGGTQFVGVGGTAGVSTATNTTILSGGVQVVGDFVSGTATNTTILSGGEQLIGRLGSGTAISTTISSGGTQVVGYVIGGTTISTTILSGGTEIISSGSIDSGARISGGEQDVYGTANNDTIFSGSQLVESGGTASGTTISGGTEYVSSGGAALGATFGGTAGTLDLEQPQGLSGTISGWQVGDVIDFVSTSVTSAGISGSTLTITVSGGSAFTYQLAGQEANTGANVQSDGAGGTDVTLVTETPIVSSGQTLKVSSGQTSNGIVVLSGGTVDVLSGGVASGTVVSSGGTEIVSAGGTDDGAQISGGTQDVSGTANSATIFTGSQVVETGGTASGTIVSGGTQVVDSGGSASATTISTGGLEVVSGTDAGARISGGTQDVSGTANSATIFTGSQVVETGGTASGTIISGGTQVVDSGGSASATTISTGGLEVVSGTDAGARISGGTQDVSGTANSATVFSGSQVVETGGTASGTIVSGGTQVVDSGGSASATTISAGGLEVVSGTDAGARISGGTQDVSGTANSATIFTGSQVVETGGTASGTIISGGTQVVDSGGSASATTISTGGLEVVSGTDAGAQISGGTQDVSGTANSATIFTGSQVVEDGGTASGTTISGGTESISSGGTDDGAKISGGTQLDYGLASGATIVTGSQVVEAGGTASGTTVSSGGTLDVLSGGLADGVIGLTTTVLQVDGSTSLTEVGNQVSSVFYLDNSSGSGPALKYAGADVTAGEFGAWTPIGAVQTAGGYDVAWELPGANEYLVWSTDSSGNYIATIIGATAGNDYALESIETTFNQDLNGDGTIGLTKTLIQTDTNSSGSTSLTAVAHEYFLYNAGGSGPLLQADGAVVTAGEFGAWVPIGAVQTAGGYDVAWELPGANEYLVWSTDSSGNYIATIIGATAGNDYALESIETTFNQDLNGDGTIGLTKTLIQTDTNSSGSTSLTTVANEYFLYNAGGSGPLLQADGAVVTAGEFGAWVPIGAVQTASGYDVAWENPGTNEYTVWSTNSSGNYIATIIGATAGNDYALESIETTFNQDLNGDGTIGLTKTLIQTDTNSSGSTSLTAVANEYFLYNAGGAGPLLQADGAVVTAGEFGAWVPIGAVQTASGYDVAWENPGTNVHTVWSTNSSGNYIATIIGATAGNDYALESIETTFNQDLNGDGTIGLTKTVIQTDTNSSGSTSLTTVANEYFLYNAGGSGPLLQADGAVVTAGEFGAWVPIGAVQTAGGYDVAWELPGANEYLVWSTDSNGNYIANIISATAGNDYALESIETTFNQDLNGDGVIGLYAAPGTTLQISAPLAGTSGSATIGAGATLELAAADSASVTFASYTGMLLLSDPSTFSGEIFNFAGNGSLSGSDQIDLKGINYNSVHDSYANGVLTVTDGTDTATLDFNGSYTLTNFDFASDGSGGTIVYDPPAPPSNAGTSGPAPVGNGATLELAGADCGSVTFTGNAGTLQLDNPSTFTGTVSGFAAQNVIDLPGMPLDAQTTLGYLPDRNGGGGTLLLSDGALNAKIALLGSYTASSFVTQSDPHGGTMVLAEATQSVNQPLLANPQHA